MNVKKKRAIYILSFCLTALGLSDSAYSSLADKGEDQELAQFYQHLVQRYQNRRERLLKEEQVLSSLVSQPTEILQSPWNSSRMQFVPIAAEAVSAPVTEKMPPTLESPEVLVVDAQKQLKHLISADFRDAKLVEILDYLSEKAEINIIPSEKVLQTETEVTLQVTEMSLEEVLKYLLQNENMTYRIEKNALWVLTQDEAKDEPVETRVYHLKEGIGAFTKFSGQGASGGTQLGSSGITTETKTIKNLLEESVNFPKDSKVILDERTGSLIVANTPSNFEIIERLLSKLDVAPSQILVEARFVELDVTDLRELGAEVTLKGELPFARRGGTPMISGLKKGAGIDYANFSRQTEGINLNFEGILTKPQFQIVLHNIDERQNAKTLSVPKITTLNNQTAIIKVVDEFVYPTRYEASVVKKDLNGDGDFLDEVSGIKETLFVNTPQDFQTRDVGIILKVTPSIGADGRSITLVLLPEVSGQTGTFTYSGEVSLPKFSSRNLSTSVVIENQETVVLGGLMKETDTKKVTKVPFLGDVPFLGNFFRRETKDKERQNLVIFVTASLLETERP